MKLSRGAVKLAMGTRAPGISPVFAAAAAIVRQRVALITAVVNTMEGSVHCMAGGPHSSSGAKRCSPRSKVVHARHPRVRPLATRECSTLGWQGPRRLVLFQNFSKISDSRSKMHPKAFRSVQGRALTGGGRVFT